MKKVFMVEENGKTRPMEQIFCSNEEKELHDLLENNYDLLVGDQINPSDPCRWVLIKREMPVPDPTSSGNRWSIDFFFADHIGMPTFVECKRYYDTRARREVVGQMMEYAANGQYYWDKDDLKRHAEETAARRKQNLDDLLLDLNPENQDSVDSFFENVENNLKEGQIRLIFLLEEAPSELKSIVDFLNKQMQRAEVLIIEAKQYVDQAFKVVVPTLFGFTEQARQIKKVVTLSKSNGRRTWDRESTLDALKSQVGATGINNIKDLIKLADDNPKILSVSYGTGKMGTIIFRNNREKSIFYVQSTGIFQLGAVCNFPSKIYELRDLGERYNDHLQWRVTFEAGKYPSLKKKLGELQKYELDKLTEFILEMANICSECTD